MLQIRRTVTLLSLQFLLCDTKCIEACEPDFHGGNNCFQKARLSAEEYDLEHEILSGDEVNNRFPGYRLPPNFKAHSDA